MNVSCGQSAASSLRSKMLAKSNVVAVEINSVELSHAPRVILRGFCYLYTAVFGALIHRIQVIDIEVEPIFARLRDAFPKMYAGVSQKNRTVTWWLSPQEPYSETQPFDVPFTGVCHTRYGKCRITAEHSIGSDISWLLLERGGSRSR